MPAKIWAHRGAPRQAPENTMLAFRRAHEIGADGIELDVSLSADGRVVVMHDDKVERTTNGAGEIAELNWAEIERLDCGMGQTPPCLDEVLEFLRGNSLEVNIEIKSGLNPKGYSGLEAKVVELVRRYGVSERTLYSSFNHNALMRVKELEPKARLGLLYSCEFVKPERYARELGAQALHPHWPSLMQSGFCAACRELGVDVRPWTVNEPDKMLRFMREGAEIITDLPDLALSVRAQL